MLTKSHRPIAILCLFVVFQLLISTACEFSLDTLGLSTATPVAPATSIPVVSATPAAKASACLLPNVVGLDQKAAETALSALGLNVLKQVEMSAQYPAGAVTMQEPQAGTRLEPCEGQARIWVSAGSGASQPTATVPAQPTRTSAPPTAAPTKAATPTAGPRLSNPAAMDVLYYTAFPHSTYGFSDVIWDVQSGAGSKVEGVGGFLNVRGQVTAMAAEATYKQVGTTTRILLKRGSFAMPLKEFTLIFNLPKDQSRYLALVCSGQPYGSAGTVLVCDIYANQSGKEVLQPNTHAEMCYQQCDIELELGNGMVKVYADGEQRILYKNMVSDEGTIGLRIDNPESTPFTLDYIAIYKAPAQGETYGEIIFREEFGGDWPTETQNDEYQKTERAIPDWGYQWTIQAKQSMVTRATVGGNLILPSNCGLHLDAVLTSGPPDTGYGLIFREQDNGKDYYYFLIRESGVIAVYLRQDGKWIELVKPVKVAGIKTGEVNHLAVEMRGSQYSLSVNYKVVANFTDSRLSGGVMGVAVDLNQGGQTAKVEFQRIGVELLP